MNRKLKILGMGLLAMMATSAFAVMNAGATEPGHFTSSTAHTTITGIESGEHRLHLTGDFGDGEVGCDKVTATGTTAAETVTSLTITPTYEECYTTPDPSNPNTKHFFPVTTDGCTYTFTITKGATFNEVHLVCPPGGAITIHHPNCTITVPPQSVPNAVDYTTVTEDVNPDPEIHDTKHAITLDVDAEFNSQYHGGICIFLGTSHKGNLDGSITVKGTDTFGNPVDITAT
jgi:hypothetical protein